VSGDAEKPSSDGAGRRGTNRNPCLHASTSAGSITWSIERFGTGGESGGRQPLTTERIGDASGFRPIAGGIEVVLEFEASGVDRALSPFVWPVLGMALEEGW
jgi:hypothetical protein